MSPEDRDRHRSQIGFKVEVVLQGYWVTELVPAMKAAVMADWADELEDWTLDQITWALREWRRENPSKKPNPGHISAILRHRRGTEMAAKISASRQQPAEPERPAITPEVAAERAEFIRKTLAGMGSRGGMEAAE